MNFTISIEPEFRDFIPPLAAEEYAQLEQNLLRDGCRDPLSMWHEVLLDGHNRYEICSRHGIPFQTVQIDGLETLEDALLWVVRNQLGRRNLTDFVRAELALRSKEALAAIAQANYEASLIKDGTVPQNSAAPVKVETREEVATLAGVSHDTVRKVEKIKQDAAPAVVDAARRGEISIDAASKVATLSVEQQDALAAAGPHAIKQAAAEQRTAKRIAATLAQGGSQDPAELSRRLGTLEDTLAETLSENAALRAEVETLRRLTESDETATAAAEEIRAVREESAAAIQQKEVEIASLRERLAGLMNEKNEAVRMVKSLQRKQGRAAA